MLKATGKVNEPEAVLLALSVTCTMKVEVTAVKGGVPDRTPPGFIVSQGPGRPVAVHV
jgi:hypothetical protein